MPDMVLSRHGTGPMVVGPIGVGPLTDTAILAPFGRKTTQTKTAKTKCLHAVVTIDTNVISETKKIK